MEVSEAVEAGAAAFAEAENKAKSIRHSFRNEMKEVLETCRNAGLIGGIECAAYVAKLDAMATSFVADLYIVHFELTELAKEKNVDLPGIESGGR